jgi:hypothetical protein
MDALKNQISDLQSPSVQKDHRSPQKAHRFAPTPKISAPKASPATGVGSKRLSKGDTKREKKSPPPESEESLVSRKEKREQESRNFRNFVKAQRQAKVDHFSELTIDSDDRKVMAHHFVTLSTQFPQL